MAGETILGHRAQIGSLLADLEAENVAHAYLFAGEKHLGKFTIAKWFSTTLLTVDAKDEEERARLTREAERLLHRDLLVIDQLWIEDVCEDFDLIAKSSNVSQQHRAKGNPAKTDAISIEDIRSLQERLVEVGSGTYRCCLIRSVERMQEPAVSALLKILEEPPAGVVFLLTTESLSSLAATLISRSRVVRFFPLGATEMIPLVSDLPEEDGQFLLRLAQGAPGTVLTLKADPDRLRLERQQYAKALNFWHARSLGERLQLLEPLSKRGEEAERFLLHLALALREERTRSPQHVASLSTLVNDLRTNASRPLVTQRFALDVSSS